MKTQIILLSTLLAFVMVLTALCIKQEIHLYRLEAQIVTKHQEGIKLLNERYTFLTDFIIDNNRLIDERIRISN